MSLQPPRDKRASLTDAVSLVSDGATVALGGGLSARLPMALVRELVRQRRRGLHLVGSAHSIDVDLLVAAGAVRRLEESYVGFEQDLGLAPAYRRAAEAGTSRWRKAAAPLSWPSSGRPRWGCRSCPSAGCAARTSPAAPGVCRDHLPVHRGDPGRRAGVAAGRGAAARAAGDRYGHLHLAQPYVLDERFASASRLVVATVDELVSTGDVTAAGVTIPAHLVAAVTEVPYGAHPSSCYPGYGYDRAHLREYVSAAQSGPDDLEKILDTYVRRRARRTTGWRSAASGSRRWPTWSESTAAWQELFL